MCNLCETMLLPPANEVWGKVIFLHLFVILFTGGHAWLQGGMRGCRRGACVVAGGHAWLYGGHAWLLGGACVVARGACMVARGACMVAPGGVCVCGCSGGACVVAPGGCVVLRGGVRGFFHEIRSMSGRYASYWNAFLFFYSVVSQKNLMFVLDGNLPFVTHSELRQLSDILYLPPYYPFWIVIFSPS